MNWLDKLTNGRGVRATQLISAAPLVGQPDDQAFHLS